MRSCLFQNVSWTPASGLRHGRDRAVLSKTCLANLAANHTAKTNHFQGDWNFVEFFSHFFSFDSNCLCLCAPQSLQAWSLLCYFVTAPVFRGRVGSQVLLSKFSEDYGWIYELRRLFCSNSLTLQLVFLCCQLLGTCSFWQFETPWSQGLSAV